jgi:hypothetical protein
MAPVEARAVVVPKVSERKATTRAVASKRGDRDGEYIYVELYCITNRPVSILISGITKLALQGRK